MCGIAGFVDHRLNSDEADKLITSMLKSTAHRGPDDTGKWINQPVVFGHNRLSIIDLSVDGHQPMHHYDLSIVFNGEIYNYIELKEELKSEGVQFKTESDTEVILACYRKYGRDCVKKFVGMWALAIWDKQTKTLFCSRDRFGIKPFYYIFKDGNLYFGSEYKSLKQTPAFSNELNLDQVNRGLQLGWICYQDETYFSCLKSLPAACNLIYSNGKIEIEKYWDIDLNKKFKGTLEEKQQTFYALFMDSIKIHMRADVEVGGCLSGGIDSSSISTAISKLFPKLNFKTFTIYYEGKDAVDERPWVNEVLKSCPLFSNYNYEPTDKDIQEHISKALYHADVPIAGSSPVSQYFVMQLAGKHKMKVLLDGQGSDEYLAGYMHSFYRLVGGLMSKFRLFDAFKEFQSHAKTQDFSLGKKADSFSKSLLTAVLSEQAVYEMEYKNYFPFLGKNKEVNFHLNGVEGSPSTSRLRSGTTKLRTSKLNKFLYHLTFTTSLPSLLHYEDRNAMAFSIESRVPFLDHRLVEFVFSLSDTDKMHFGTTKNILRNSLKDLLPEKIFNRKDKKGFVTPGEVKWLRGCLKHMLDIDYKKLDFISEVKAREVIEDFKKGNDKNANLVWRIAMLGEWLKLAN